MEMMPIFHNYCLRYRHNFVFFYQLLNNNLFIHHMHFFKREESSENYDPGSILYHIAFAIYFYFILFLDILIQKPKNTLLHFILFVIYLFNLLQLSPITHQFLAPLPERG